MNKYIAKKDDAGKTISKFLTSYYTLPYSLVMKALRNKEVKINGKRVKDKNYKIKLNDEIITYFKAVEIKKIEYTKLKKEFEIIYGDKNLMIVDKPFGLNTFKENENNLRDQVLTYLSDTNKLKNNSSFMPINIHQLDKNTTGCVIFALNYETLQVLQEAIKDHKMIIKEYIAVVVGNVYEPRLIDIPLAHNELEQKIMPNKHGKEAKTQIYPLNAADTWTVLRVILKTGRKHQIRAHLAAIGNPIIADQKYGKKGKRMCLCAKTLKFEGFNDKFSYLNNKVFEAKLPSHFDCFEIQP